MARKKIVDAFLKKLLGDTSVNEQKMLASEAGIHPPRTPKEGELDFSTSQIDRWITEGAPGLTQYAQTKKRIAEKQKRSPLTRLRDWDKKAKKKAAEREQRLELDFNRPRTGEEISELFNIDEQTKELHEKLNSLKTTGQAVKNLEDFSEALTNRKIIEAAIRSGYAKPTIWNQVEGLPPWPKELRKAETIAKIRLNIDPYKEPTAKFPSDIQREKIKGEMKKLSGANGRTPEEVMSKINQEQIATDVRNLMTRQEATGTRVYQKRLRAKEEEELAQLERERSESGLDFDPEERIKGEYGKPQPSPQEEIISSWRKVSSDPRAEQATGVHPRTGEMLPEELPWSLDHEKRYNTLLREKQINDPNYIPTAIEKRELQKQVADEFDKDWEFSDKFIPVDMPRPSDVRRTTASGEETIIPVTKGRQAFIRGDFGSPAGAMHDPMRGAENIDEAVEDMGLLPGQEMEFASTADNIDLEAIMQRYSNPEEILEKLRQNPDIAIPPSVNIDRAIQQRIDRKAAPSRQKTLERLMARPEFQQYIQKTSRTFEPDRQLDLPIRTEPTAEVAADLRSRASELTRIGEQFKREVSELPVEQRKQAEIEIINRPEYREFQAARRALKREIGIVAPDLMEYAPSDKRVTSKRKLVDTFKKGRKIVNRKRGGLLKKPRGWGAARYKGT